MADEEVIINVEYNTDEAEKNIVDLTESITNLELTNKNLRVDLKKTDKQLKEEGKSRQDLIIQIEKNKQLISSEKKERRDSIKFVQAENNSREKLKQTISKLRKERNNLDVTTEKGAKQSEILRQKIDELDEKLKESGTEFEKNKINIGNYTESIKSAFEEAGGLSSVFKDVTNNLNDTSRNLDGSKPAWGAIASGIGQATKASLKFIATPIGAIIAAIVVVIQGLTAAIKRNEGVMDSFTEIFRGVSIAIEAVIGRIQKLIPIVKSLFKGQIDLNEAIDQGKEAFNGLQQEMKEAYNLGVQLAKIQKQLEETTIDNTTALAKLNKITQKNQAIADDATRSFKDREEANKRAAQAAEEAARIEAEFAKQQLAEVNFRFKIAEQQGRINRQLRQEQADAIAAQITAEANLTAAIFENEKVRRELKQDRLERDLDILIDGFDNTKTINDRIIANDKLFLEKRIESLVLLEKESRNSFNRQIETIKQFTNAQFNENELLQEQNAVILNEKIRQLGLSETIEGRLLEIIKERRIVEAEFLESQQIINESLLSFNEKLTDSLENSEEIFLEILDNEIQAEIDAIDSIENERLEANKREIQAEKEKQSKKKSIIQQGFTQAQQLTNDFFTFQNTSRDQQEQRELQAAGNNEQEKEKIRKRFAQRRKNDAVKQAIINGALAVTSALATVQPFIPAGVAAGVIAGIKSGLEVATIRKQTFENGGQIKFSHGGEVKSGTFAGNSHANGGIDLFTGSGQHVANVEGNENFYVVKKNASDYINTLSSINEKFGGRSFKYSNGQTKMQDGGIAQTDITQQNIDFGKQVREALQGAKFAVNVEDISTGLSDREEVINVGVIQ